MVLLIILTSGLGSWPVLGQEEPPHKGIERLNQYLLGDSIPQARKSLDRQLNYFIEKAQYDSLCNYPNFVGRIALLESGVKTAVERTEKFMKFIDSHVKDPRRLKHAYSELSDFYTDIGEHSKAVTATHIALDHLLKAPDVLPEELAQLKYNLGFSAYELDSLYLAKQYFDESIALYQSSGSTKMDALADAYNAAGAMAWTFNQLEKAESYFQKAVDAIHRSDEDTTYRRYLASVFMTNIALLQESQNQLQKSIKTHETVLSESDYVVKNTDEDYISLRAKRNKAIAMGNLAATYGDLGNLSKSKELLELSLKLKGELYEPGDVRITNTLIQIGKAQLLLRNFDAAMAMVNQALAQLKTNSSEYLIKRAQIYSIAAETHWDLGQYDSALLYFQKSDELYQGVYDRELTQEYLIFLRTYARFLAKNGLKEDAKKTAMKGYAYIDQSNPDHASLLPSLLNLSEVNYYLEDYDESIKWSERGMEILNTENSSKITALDSIKLNYHRPKLLLFKVRSEYQVTTDRSVGFYENLVEELQFAIAILEQRKQVLFKSEDINRLLEDFQSVNDFLKQLNLELYEKTGDQKFLESVLSHHEYGIYQRIRTKFSLKNNIGFSKLPEAMANREEHLGAELVKALNTDDPNALDDFINATSNWSRFMDSLKVESPDYFKMRYATLAQPLEDLHRKVPERTTLVRYLFIQDRLYAWISDGEENHWVNLQFSKEENQIGQLAHLQNDLESIARVSYTLYQQLWQPFEEKIKTERVIIFPDQELFNLSFEMLTPERVTDFGDFATQSLLARYMISYNYSLQLLDNYTPIQEYEKYIVAYAPAFTAEMKTDYKMAIVDSAQLDKTYLMLLPQPFTSDLVDRVSSRFDGSSFFNIQASKQVFSRTASEHKIIHIGTHAESNNVSPELSRLIFAKNLADTVSIEDNYLYAYEIYDQNLNSHLAILTACETGKPVHQAGEGMISLAHAFNYAGSESILTSLWKIDEQSSAKIVSSFYEYLSEGLTKDEALRNAKLDYLANSRGRTSHPQYWAGLVLIGDAAPISLPHSLSGYLWMGVFTVPLVLLFLWLLLVLKRRKNKAIPE